ncbi:sensor histidine kinase [Streptomyces sp. NPDC088354]|uniref:sensor histidine kinase n=1 Tax=unclassified Streptomyces TaxID=2593676 RepID=UPI0029B0ADA6|nr:sensor histidine kinase [Streptomyces sp. MI02-7b]MDX3077463.1 sensor histidine kinase [Streptomyces sp. MI02-7b]
MTRPGRGALRLGFEVFGTACLAAAVFMEVTDREVSWELVLSFVAAVSYLLMIPLCAAHQRIWLLVATAVALMLTVAGVVRVAEEPLLSILHVFPLLLAGYAIIASRASSRREARLRRERVRARHDGEERERRRWARELHDDTLQELGAVQVVLSSAAADGGPDAMSSAIEQARALVGNQIVSLRHLIVDLRPVVLDELGLHPALQALCRHTSETFGIRTDLRVTSHGDALGGRLAPETQAQVYRIVQEAITNAVKHAEPTRIVVSVEADAGTAQLTVTDNGCGMPEQTAAGRSVPLRTPDQAPPYSRGMGLSAMRERADLIDARLTVRSAPGEGTTVALRVPLTPPDASGESQDTTER